MTRTLSAIITVLSKWPRKKSKKMSSIKILEFKIRALKRTRKKSEKRLSLLDGNIVLNNKKDCAFKRIQKVARKKS